MAFHLATSKVLLVCCQSCQLPRRVTCPPPARVVVPIVTSRPPRSLFAREARPSPPSKSGAGSRPTQSQETVKNKNRDRTCTRAPLYSQVWAREDKNRHLPLSPLTLPTPTRVRSPARPLPTRSSCASRSKTSGLLLKITAVSTSSSFRAAGARALSLKTWPLVLVV
jgi:hypothetical protein